EEGIPENRAQLVGVLLLPRQFASQKWGEVRVEEVIDAQGNNLKMEEGRPSSGWTSFGGMSGERDEDTPGEDRTGSDSKQRKMLTLQFRPPDWKVKEIARIKASLGLQYLAGSPAITKLTNAVPANWIN